MSMEQEGASARSWLTRKEFLRAGAAGLGASLVPGALIGPGVARAATPKLSH